MGEHGGGWGGEEVADWPFEMKATFLDDSAAGGIGLVAANFDPVAVEIIDGCADEDLGDEGS